MFAILYILGRLLGQFCYIRGTMLLYVGTFVDRILVNTIVGSMMALAWSAVLLVFIMLCSGMFLAQMVEDK